MSAGWLIAKEAVHDVFEQRGCPVQIGRVKRLGESYDRDAYLAPIEGVAEFDRCIALLPHADALDIEQRVVREARILDDLARLELPFRVPQALGISRLHAGRPVLVRTLVGGLCLEERMAWQTTPPMETTARLAAAVHQIDWRALAPLDESYVSRQAHARHCLAVFDLKKAPTREAGNLITRAGEWARENLPTDGEPALLHGDLLVHNIIVDLFKEEVPGLIDWEYAQVGDPAYDLAIVTRGVRRPFRTDHGLERFVELYRAAGGCDVQPADVHFYEAGLLARWLMDSDAAMLDETLTQMRAFLRRVGMLAQRGGRAHE